MSAVKALVQSFGSDSVAPVSALQEKRLQEKRFLISSLSLAFWFVSASLVWSAEQKPRMGIIAGGELDGVADLLTVELSGSTDVILVERGEIHKVLRELSLSAARSASDYLKLGRILKIDGLLILEPVEMEGKKAVSTRLVAVNPGVVLGSVLGPLPVPDPEAWNKLTAKRFVPLFPKLMIPAKDGIPVSIFNLYSSIDTPETRGLERELSILLAHRLTRERDIFVLERWRMEQLAWEKDLELEKDNPFWTGSCLLDGRIDGTTVFGTEAEINVILRLRFPQGKRQIEIKAAGRKNDLPALVNDLAARVMGALNKTTAKSEWDSKAEAEQYFQEAKWASAHNLSWIVHNACENAWALGCRTDELARLRIGSYCRGNDLESAILAMELFCQYQKDLPSLLGTRLDPKNDRTRLESGPSWGSKVGLSWHTTTRERQVWVDCWNSVIEHASQVLKRYHDDNLSAGNEERLRDLRMLVRSATDGLVSRGEKQLNGLKCMYAPYWYETPEQILDAYRSVAGLLGLRDVMCDFPWLIWKEQAEGKRLDALTRIFIGELCASVEPGERLGGMMLTYLFLADEKRNLDGLADMLWSDRERIVNGGIPDWQAIAYSRILKWLEKEEFKNYWLKYTKYFFDENRNVALFLEMRKPLGFLNWPLESYYSPEDAGELYRCFLKYVQEQAKRRPLTAPQMIELFRYETSLLTRYPRLQMASPVGRLAMEGWSAGDIQQVHDLFMAYQCNVATSPELSDENRAELQRQKEWVVANASDKTRPTEVFRVTRFCYLESIDWIHSIVWANDKLWVLNRNGPRVVEVEPATFRANVFHVPKRDGAKRGDGIGGGKTKLMITANSLVYLGGGRLLTYDLALKRWKEIKLPCNNYDASAMIGDRLCLGFAKSSNPFSQQNPGSGILRIDIQNEVVELLGTSRRRPALTNLDDTEPYGRVECFFQGFGNRICVCLCPTGSSGGRLYSYDETKHEWEYVGDRDRNYCMSVAPFEGGTLIYYDYQKYFIVRPEEEKLQLLLGHDVRSYVAPATARWERPRDFDEPARILYAGDTEGQCSAAFDGKNLWVFRHNQFGHHWWLWYFDGRTGIQVPIPLEFSLGERDGQKMSSWVRNKVAAQEKELNGTPFLILTYTPYGIALCSDIPGFWFLPMKDIEEYVARKLQAASYQLKGKETNAAVATAHTPMWIPEIRSDRQSESSVKTRDGPQTNVSQPTKISVERNERTVSRSSARPNQTYDAKRGIVPYLFEPFIALFLRQRRQDHRGRCGFSFRLSRMRQKGRWSLRSNYRHSRMIGYSVCGHLASIMRPVWVQTRQRFRRTERKPPSGFHWSAPVFQRSTSSCRRQLRT